MEVATNGDWFSHAGTLGTIGLVGALICAVLAIIFLIKQYKGQPKAAKMTRLFFILGIVFLLVARFAPQENTALSYIHDESETDVEQDIEKSVDVLRHDADSVLNSAQQELEKFKGAVEEFGNNLKEDASTILDMDNQEVQSLTKEFSDEMNQDDAKLDAGLHGGLEKETDIAINEIEDYVVIPTDEADKTSQLHADQYSAEQHGIEQEALVAMREHALKEVQAISGVQSARWNESLLPDLQLDVVANVTPESAISLMNVLCTSLSDNTVQPATVSIKDLKGGQIARQMCGTLTQGVE